MVSLRFLSLHISTIALSKAVKILKTDKLEIWCLRLLRGGKVSVEFRHFSPWEVSVSPVGTL